MDRDFIYTIILTTDFQCSDQEGMLNIISKLMYFFLKFEDIFTSVNLRF